MVKEKRVLEGAFKKFLDPAEVLHQETLMSSRQILFLRENESNDLCEIESMESASSISSDAARSDEKSNLVQIDYDEKHEDSAEDAW